MEYETLLVEQDFRVRWVTLNRPEKLNAISPQLLIDLTAAIADAETDEATRVLVIRGAGRAFSAGYDVGSAPSAGTESSGAASIQSDLGHLLSVNQQLARLWNSRLPVLAQVHGYCLAGGSDLALHCDLLIASEDARIGYPPARFLGVPPTQMWLYNVGPQWAKRLLFGGETISGTRAAELGLALEAVRPDDLENRVARHAHQIAKVGRDFLIGMKLVVNHGLELMGRSALQTYAASQDAIGHQSPDALSLRAAIASKGFANVMRELNGQFDDDLV